MTDVETGWAESASELFIDVGKVFTPSRAEQLEMMGSLLPAERDDSFVAVDLACGAGPLSAALLERFPRCRVLALDGSPTMLEAAAANLAKWQGRFELRLFNLKDDDWLDTLPSAVRVVVSSLAIHHLDADEKQHLFRRLAGRLEPGGALLIADIVEPANTYSLRAYAVAWDEVVRRQSEEELGSATGYERFQETEWNIFVHPDPGFDKPSNLFEQLEWLRASGFADVDCFWLRAGHAIYGGYVATQREGSAAAPTG